ncbi:hypothetical protein KR059_000165, partial [Drosophila kikkawai]
MLEQVQQEMSKSDALHQKLLEPCQTFELVVNNQKLTMERDSLLEQVQQEMSKGEALRQQLLEYEQSQQSILDCVMQQNTARIQEMSLQIEEISRQSQGFQDEMHDLNRQLENIVEENTCAICLSPWDAEGDHRLVSLRCGHIFGKNCIQEHLTRYTQCPYCMEEVRSGDTRDLYGCKILS